MTVLVVEDDPDQLAIRSMLLRECGFEILEADCPGVAVITAKANRPECAVLDLKLPGEQDGLRLIRDLKTILPDLLIYVMSGSPLQVSDSSPELKLAESVFRKGASIAPLLQRLIDVRTSRQEV